MVSGKALRFWASAAMQGVLLTIELKNIASLREGFNPIEGLRFLIRENINYPTGLRPS